MAKMYINCDVELQQFTQQALKGYQGSVVAISPFTGDILAMASSPTYDANLFSTSHPDLDLIFKNPDNPMFNRSIKGQFPLASTIKPFVALYA